MTLKDELKLEKLFKVCESCPGIMCCLEHECETYRKQQEIINRDSRTQDNERM